MDVSISDSQHPALDIAATKLLDVLLTSRTHDYSRAEVKWRNHKQASKQAEISIGAIWNGQFSNLCWFLIDLESWLCC